MKPKPEECDCCHFETTELKEYENNSEFPRRMENKWLCALCAGTLTGSWADFPRQHNFETLEIMRTICYVGNAIIAAVKK